MFAKGAYASPREMLLSNPIYSWARSLFPEIDGAVVHQFLQALILGAPPAFYLLFLPLLAGLLFWGAVLVVGVIVVVVKEVVLFFLPHHARSLVVVVCWLGLDDGPMTILLYG